MHIAVIMDGNGRWAQQRSLPRYKGHQQGVQATRLLLDSCVQEDITHITLFTLSTENLHRPTAEVSALHDLLITTLRSEMEHLCKQDISVSFIGSSSLYSDEQQEFLEYVEDKTANGNQLRVTIAFNYSGRWDIEQAIVSALERTPDDALRNQPHKLLPSSKVPNIDLLIRTGGSKRISNFCLWQLAYSELYFTDVLWPDFTPQDLTDALTWYESQKRTFGLLSATNTQTCLNSVNE